MEGAGGRKKIRQDEKIFGGMTTMTNDAMELVIYNQEDRLAVAQILVKNGYTVSQGKRKKTETGKQLDYFLKVSLDAENADTSR